MIVKKKWFNVHRNVKSNYIHIKSNLGAEYILRWLPIGTHDWNKFIRPEELEKKLSIENFKTIEVKGLVFNPLNSKWKRSDNLSVNYIICSSKV